MHCPIAGMSLRRISGSAVIARFVRAAAFERSSQAARARASLGRTERAALERLRTREARRDYLAAQWLARQLAAERTAAAPLELSISHADGIALCALGEGCAFGVDVESMRAVARDQWGLVAKVFGVA